MTTTWYDQGMKKGLELGMQQGLQEGLQKGLQEGQRRLVLSQLEARDSGS